MNNKKSIDRLFREKFRDFEPSPPDYVWENIQEKMQGKKKRKVLPLWWWSGGIAAGLALFLGLRLLLSPAANPGVTRQDALPASPEVEMPVSAAGTSVTATEEKSTPDNTTGSGSQAEQNTSVARPPVIFAEAKNTGNTTVASAATTGVVKPHFNKQKQKPASGHHPQVQQPSVEYARLAGIESAEDTGNFTGTPLASSVETQEEYSGEKLDITAMEIAGDTPAEESRWAVSGYMAPAYMDFYNKDLSNIDPRFNGNPKHGVVMPSYGMSVQYKMNDQLHLELSLQETDYAFVTEDIYVTPSGRTPQYSGIISDEDEVLAVSPSPRDNPDDDFNVIEEYEKGSIVQSFSYLEIPLSGTYRLYGDSSKLSAIGGVSTLILHQNDVYVQTREFSDKIGRSALNNLNFSAHIGLEYSRPLYRGIDMYVRPVVKFHGHTFKRVYSFNNPYAVGLYTGLNYRF